MKQKIILSIILYIIVNLTTIVIAQTNFKNNSKSNGIIIYSNSFESPEDTSGWKGIIEFSSDTPPDGGKQSAYISGGCDWPHAWFDLGPFENAGFFLLRCWGKDLAIGGIILIESKDESQNQIYININKKNGRIMKVPKHCTALPEKELSFLWVQAALSPVLC